MGGVGSGCRLGGGSVGMCHHSWSWVWSLVHELTSVIIRGATMYRRFDTSSIIYWTAPKVPRWVWEGGPGRGSLGSLSQKNFGLLSYSPQYACISTCGSASPGVHAHIGGSVPENWLENDKNQALVLGMPWERISRNLSQVCRIKLKED